MQRYLGGHGAEMVDRPPAALEVLCRGRTAGGEKKAGKGERAGGDPAGRFLFHVDPGMMKKRATGRAGRRRRNGL
jgi:hypothetical protein